MSDLDQRRSAFGERLRQLRERAGHATGSAFARHLSWHQSKVSRIETGAQVPADSDVTAWATACGASESVTAELATEVLELRIASASWKRQLRTGNQARQEHAVAIEAAASVIRVFETAVVPGLLQTADYARHVFTTNAAFAETPADVDDSVTVRMQRQAVLYDSTKTIDIVITEAALRFPVCPSDVLAGQIDRLLSLLGLPNVRFGIIPLDTRLPVVPMHGFWIIDDQVIVETIDSEIVLDDADEVTLYRRMADAMWSVAAEGDQARALLAAQAERWAASSPD